MTIEESLARVQIESPHHGPIVAALVTRLEARLASAEMVVKAAKKLDLNGECTCGYCEEHGSRACTGCECGWQKDKNGLATAIAAHSADKDKP